MNYKVEITLPWSGATVTWRGIALNDHDATQTARIWALEQPNLGSEFKLGKPALDI